MTNKQAEVLERARALLAEMNVGHQVPTMRINTRFAKYKTLPVTASKIGGIPYLPKRQDGPVDVNGEPLHMIAQINCATCRRIVFTRRRGCCSSGLARPRPIRKITPRHDMIA